jgi:hypothetical protein
MRKITANVHQCQNCRRFRTRFESGVCVGGWPQVLVEERPLIRRYQGTFEKFTPGTHTGSLAQVLPEWSGIDGILHPVFVSPADYPILSPRLQRNSRHPSNAACRHQPASSIGLSVVASNVDGSLRPNVLAVSFRRFSLSKVSALGLHRTTVHLQERRN